MGELQLHLLRYGEIGTKSPNVRKHFEDILMQNIERTFLSKEEEVITERRGRGRIFAYAREKNSYLFSRIFGLVSYSRAKEVDAELEEMKREGRKFAEKISGTFAVRARRVGEQDYNSQEVESELGDVILEENPDLEVDLDDPDHEFYVEIRHSTAYLFTGVQEAPGGLPLSSQGKVAAYVEDKNDLVATWLMMKRGARPFVYHPGSKWVKKLDRWDPNLKERRVEDLREMIDSDLPNEVHGIVLGQTLNDFSKIDRKALILRPLIGLTKSRIQEIFERIERLEEK
ncbi:MAG: THUMP domain-containing protein [Candidatus Natronoplasma sp.]